MLAAGCAHHIIRVAAPEERRCPLCRGPMTGAVRIMGREAGGLVSAGGGAVGAEPWSNSQIVRAWMQRGCMHARKVRAQPRLIPPKGSP